MGTALAHHLECGKFPKDAVSYVSVGDGSVNNAHFLTAINLAEYARFRKFKCPVLFAVTDNNLCISLKGSGWLQVTPYRVGTGCGLPLHVGAIAGRVDEETAHANFYCGRFEHA